VTGFAPGAEVVLAAFAGHWRGPPHWPGAVFRSDPDGSSRVASVLEGEADLVEAAPAKELSALARSGSAQFLEHPGLLLASLAFNVKPGPDNPFADPEVRRAVALTIDREELIEEAFGGRARPASQLAPPTVFGHLTGLAPLEPDIEAARAALARSRFRGGFRSPLHFGPRDRRLADLIRRSTSPIGIEFELEEFPSRTLGSRIIAGKSPAFLSRSRFPNMDSTDVLDAGLHTKSPDGRHGMLNFHSYSNPELDRLLDRSGTEVESRKRFAMLEQAMQIGMEARVLIPLCFPYRLYGARRDLRWQGSVLGRIRLEEITEAVE